MSLSSMLNEVFIGRPVLYHFSRYQYFHEIITSNALKPSNSPFAVYLTRSYKADIIGYSGMNVRFTLDKQLLKDYYAIEPRLHGLDGYRRVSYNNLEPKHQYVISQERELFKKEAEEVIKNKVVKPLNKFVLQIDVLLEGELYTEYHEALRVLLNSGEYDKKLDELVLNEFAVRRFKNSHFLPFFIKFLNKRKTRNALKQYLGKINVVDKWYPVKL